MSIEAVRDYFKKWNIEDCIKEFPVSSATVEEAAKALNCEEKRIAKSMAFLVEGKPILIVTAGDAKVDNRKYKEKFKKKATMLKADEVRKHKLSPI